MWMLWLAFSTPVFAISRAESIWTPAVRQIESTRAEISEDEKHQREALSHLFSINQKIKEIAKQQGNISQQVLSHEADVRVLAQEVQVLEHRKDDQTALLSKRLRQLYQSTRDTKGFQWLFSARTPLELERNHRFLRYMIDSDHDRLRNYLVSLNELKNKRSHLKLAVAKLIRIQRQGQAKETELGQTLKEKSRYISEIKKSKDVKLSQLKSLRSQHSELNDLFSYAFFEKKGALLTPVDAPITREYGTYVDPRYRFRLTHKGIFYSGSKRPVRAVFKGRVVFAGSLPGYGRAVILDHGDNYHSVYGFAAKVRVKVGMEVSEGEVLGSSGEMSPLFGPGLYFEIRHFTDAVDPRPWFKESLIKTADSR
jgi:septal ring factor EnvC (AmiA/AmiB activator)